MAPLNFPTARAAHGYVAVNSAGPERLHWTVVWDRHTPPVEAGLVSYGYLLFYVGYLRPVLQTFYAFRDWVFPSWR